MVKSKNLVLVASILAMTLIGGCQTMDFNDTKFIDSLPTGVSTAFIRADSVWIVQGAKKKIVKIGNGSNDVPFKTDGPYLIAPTANNKTLYLQYSDGDVGTLELPSK